MVTSCPFPSLLENSIDILFKLSICTMAIENSESQIISNFVRVTEIEGKGRGLVASQPLKGGQIILQESPILTFSAFPLKPPQKQQEVDGSSLCTTNNNTITTTTNVHSTKYCAHCYQCLELLEGFTCPSCSHHLNDVVFCSSKCQSLAITTTHTPWVCYALTQLRHCSLLMDHPCQEHQVQARYLVAAYNLAMTSPEGFENLLSLHGDGKAREIMETATFLHSVITSTLSFPKELLCPSPTIETIAALLDKESCNSFSLMEPYTQGGGRSARAYGMYKNASYFNHDCLPNACRFDYLDTKTANDINYANTEIVVRMIHDVLEGEEVCLSYFRVGLSYRERTRRLLGYFGFACFCNRCKVEMNETKHEVNDDNTNNNVVGDGDSWCDHFFARFMCERENCGGTLAPLPSSSYTNSGNSSKNVMECNFCGNLTEIM